MPRAKLQHEIRWRIQFVVNDCTTYMKARSEPWYLGHTTAEPSPVFGGGNFLMAHGLFAALNFMAKVYVHLNESGRYFSSHSDDMAVKNAVRVLRKVEHQETLKELFPEVDFRQLLHSDAHTRWKPPRANECTDETGAFKKFITDLNLSVDLGIPSQEAPTVWATFRNSLTHMAAPGNPVEVGAPDGVKAFRRISGAWRCNVDRLTLDLTPVAEWLCVRIDETTAVDRIRETYRWVLNQQGGLRSKSTETTQGGIDPTFIADGSSSGTFTTIPSHMQNSPQAEKQTDDSEEGDFS